MRSSTTRPPPWWWTGRWWPPPKRNGSALVEAARWLAEDRDAAYRLGARAREVTKERFGLDRFLVDWDRLMEEETCASR
ncbi:glycosyltransferase [Micromonospora sp. DT47]|uniref:glycosyltransferase n=1 Tax=Micromonospora sp. DT47 TaxID=3393431 RepID=UPI003CEB831A